MPVIKIKMEIETEKSLFERFSSGCYSRLFTLQPHKLYIVEVSANIQKNESLFL